MAVWYRVPSLVDFAPYALAAGFLVLGHETVGDQDRSSLLIAWPAAAEADPRSGSSGSEHTAGLGEMRSPRAGAVKPSSVSLVQDETDAGSLQVVRSGKGDPLIFSPQAVIAAALRRESTTGPILEGSSHAGASTGSTVALPVYDVAMSLEADPLPASPESEAEIAAAAAEPGVEPPETESPFGTAWLYFGGAHMKAVPGVIQPWGEGEAPIIVAAPTGASPASFATAGKTIEPAADERRVSAIPTPPLRRRVVPAALLGLENRARARAERCLANAVYFEARSEPVRGQIAVAQVVLNRAFSGYYPEDVCGVVYQGANRHLSCQFTFACDGIPDVVTEPEPWRRAQRIAKAVLDGKLWLPDVGKATHYHASYVNPYWVRSMQRLRRIGLHTFYRPRTWGDGADAPAWGSPAHAEIAANL